MKYVLIAFIFIVLGYAIGEKVTIWEREMRILYVSGMCKSSDKSEAYIAIDGDDFKCFRINNHTKKINQSSIILP